MKYNRLDSDDLDVSEICPGTKTFGEQNSEAQAHQQLDYAVSRGINFFDAAEMYAVPPRAEMQARTQSYVGSWQKDQQRNGLGPATMAIAFVRSRWFVASTIIGATSLDELQEAIDVVDVELSESVLVEFGAIHQRYPNPAL